MEAGGLGSRFGAASLETLRIELVSCASRFREATLNVHIQVSVRFSFQGPRQAGDFSLVVPALGSRSLVAASLFVNTFCFVVVSFFSETFDSTPGAWEGSSFGFRGGG